MRHAASHGVTGPAAHRTCGSDMATDGTAVDEQIFLRIANAPRDVGWMMVSVGVLGVILPGLIGTPFLDRDCSACTGRHSP
jgi:hypothetical protein